MEFVQDYGLFLAKTVTLVVALLVSVAVLAGLVGRGREHRRERLEVRRLNERYEEMAHSLRRQLAQGKKARKQLEKTLKQQRKARDKSGGERRRVFVLDFHGDIKASHVDNLREEVTAVLNVAEAEDEVVVRVESPGGLVHGYGLAASQLARIRARGIPLTVAVDKVAASGGYLMAVVADRILAAPFAIVGSIGVVAQLPNFHRLLKKHDIDYELLTAGEYKRTLTMFGENTEEGRHKFKAELEDTHALFKQFIHQYRPGLELDKVATGEHWLGSQAKDLGLVDQLQTSDDYLLERSRDSQLLQLSFHHKRPLGRRLTLAFESALGRLLSGGSGGGVGPGGR